MPTANKRKKATVPKRSTTRRARPASRPAPQAMSLHVGLNAVNPKHYEGWSGDLAACENDASEMATIARTKGMQGTTVLTSKATRKNVLAEIRKASKRLGAGDLFFLTYSGHGGQLPDINDDEADRRDETWCLYDAQLIDDELYLELSHFAKDVRILVLSDSCHSGTVVRAAQAEEAARAPRSKAMPRSVADKTYSAHKAFYDRLQRAAAEEGHRPLIEPDAALAAIDVSDRVATAVTKFDPAVILISGCQDNQTSLDRDKNGAFTEQVLSVWNAGRFTSTVLDGIKDAMKAKLVKHSAEYISQLPDLD